MAAFDFIPIVGSVSGTVLKVAYLAGLSTAHASTDTDRGRLYGELAESAGTYTLSLYNDVAKDPANLVAEGTTTSLESYFDLAEENSSGITGRAWIDSYAGADENLILIPTFAVDQDVFVNQTDVAGMPGYDEDEGLAAFHARAMREILTSGLPAAVPYLFDGGTGLSAFVPQGQNVSLPDLTKIASADQLRVAQAHLVKAMSAEEAEHTEEFAEMARAARERYNAVMAALALANVKDEEVAAEGTGAGFEVGTFTRN